MGCDGQWLLDRLVVQSSEYVENIVFTKQKKADAVLSRALWVQILEYLPTDAGRHVLSAPNAVFQLAGNALHGLGVTGLETMEGLQRVSLSFRAFVGSLSAVFAPNQRPNALQETVCGLSARTVNDVILPALNLASVEPDMVEEDLQSRLNDQLQALRENRLNLEFYATLIARFVAAQDRPCVQTHVADLPDQVEPKTFGEKPDASGIT